MKQFIITYEDNLDFARQTKFMMKQQYDIEPEIIVGNKIDDINSRTQVMMSNWIDHILPKAIECSEDVIIYEDDVRLTKSLKDLPFDCNDIVWFGFRRDIYDNFLSYKKKIHLDNAFSKFCVKFSKKYKIYQPKLSYCYEQPHTSLISLDDWSTYSSPLRVRSHSKQTSLNVQGIPVSSSTSASSGDHILISSEQQSIPHSSQSIVSSDTHSSHQFSSPPQSQTT